MPQNVDAERAEAHRLRGCGLSTRQIAQRMRRPESTVRRWLRGVPPARGSDLKGAVEDMRDAARELEDDWDEPADVIWRREEERSARSIKKAQHASTFRWRAPDRNGVILAVISDMHIAPGTPCDFARMREDAELIRDTPNCYAVLAGDQVDNHIRIHAAMLNSRSTPEDQYRLFEYYLRILGDKCIVVTSGNHDDWTKQYGGVDMLGRIVRDQRVFYAPDEAWIELEVGSQKYVVGIRHQYRFNSSDNQTHTVKKWLKMGPREFDVGIIGHHHEAAIEQVLYRERFRWVARPGSYQVTSAYARQKGYNHAVPTCPTFLFHGDEYGITGWNSLRAMGRSVKTVRELGAV